MVQTKAGAAKLKARLLARDPDYYKKLGKIGGKNSSGYEFAHGRVSPADAGRKGGTISKRRKSARIELTNTTETND